MIAHLLGLPSTPLVSFLVLSISGLSLYFGLSGLSYLVFFVLGRRRFHPAYVAEGRANRRAMRLGAIGTLGNAVLVLPFYLLIAEGKSKIYWNVAEHGVPYLVLSVFLYLAFTETCIYWIHRWLHTDRAYRSLHRDHHEWRASTSWVSMAFHPADSFLQALPHHLIGFLVPVHGWIYLVMVSFVSVWAVMIHDRVSFVRVRWLNYTGHHTLHHWFYDCNYGQFLTFWDRLMGTWRDPALAGSGEEAVPEGLLR